MKKSLIALAVLGAFAGAASAQSSVTLYGIVDVNVQRTDPKVGTSGVDTSATTGVNSGHLAGNRWGLRGSEDLGGGMRAIFQLESGYSLDNGTSLQGGRLFGRQAYAGLAGGFGTLVAGRLATFSSGTGSFDKFGTIDPFRTGYGFGGMQNTFSSANATRFDNTIAYVTPTMGGFSAGIGHTFATGGGENAGGSSNNNNGQIMYANFSAGPLYVVLTYDRIKIGVDAHHPTVASDPTEKHLQIGAAYDLKVVRLSAGYAKEDDIYPLAGLTTTPQQAAGSDATAWIIGVAAPFGPHRLAASYQKRDVDSFGTTPEGDRKVWTVGYEYSLSRRTTFYASYADLKDDGSLKTAASGGVKQITAGLFHSF